MKYLIGFLFVGLGFLIIWKSEKIFSWTGTMESAEKYLGVGQTRLFIKLLGVVIIFVSFLVMLGVVQGVLTSLFVR